MEIARRIWREQEQEELAEQEGVQRIRDQAAEQFVNVVGELVAVPVKADAGSLTETMLAAKNSERHVSSKLIPV